MIFLSQDCVSPSCDFIRGRETSMPNKNTGCQDFMSGPALVAVAVATRETGFLHTTMIRKSKQTNKQTRTMQSIGWAVDFSRRAAHLQSSSWSNAKLTHKFWLHQTLPFCPSTAQHRVSPGLLESTQVMTQSDSKW